MWRVTSSTAWLACAAGAISVACSLILPTTDDLAGGSGGSAASSGNAGQSGAGTSGGGGSAGSDAGDGGVVFGPVMKCDAGCTGQYVVQSPANLPNPSDTTTCSDFGSAPCIELCGKKGGTDNVVRCQFVWGNGAPQRFYGCCEVSDKSLVVNAEAGALGQYYRSDEIEYYLGLNLACDTNTTKTAIAIAAEGGRLAVNYPDAACGSSKATVANKVQSSLKVYVGTYGTLNDTLPDQGYRIKWVHDMPLAVPADGATYFCDFLIGDIDALDGGQTSITAFSAGDMNNLQGVDTWGKCVFVP